MKTLSPVPLACSTWGDEELKALQDVIDSGRFTMGPKVAEFEKIFADYHDSKYCVMVNSGSSANFLMIAALFFTKRRKNLNRGDEVIVPAVSWSTTYSPLHYHGLKVRFVDVDLNTLNINIELIEAAITKNTKAIFAVNLLGNPADYKRLIEICKKHDLILIEDNCESLGAEYLNKRSGSFGLVSSCSAFFSHHISTMEGGLILTDDEEIYHILLSIRAHGWTRDLPANNLICEKNANAFFESFRFIFPGYNVRPLEMSGAIGIAQMKKLDSLIEKRRANYYLFRDRMEQFNFIKLQLETGNSSWFGFSMIVDENSGYSRNDLVSCFSLRNIECRPIVCGNIMENEMISYFDYSVSGELRASNTIHNNGLFIGNHHIDISDGLDILTEVLQKFVK
jgi:CDP-4-dehydro-6-deoxyglucose reductase, E1